MGRQYRISTASPFVIQSATDRTKDQTFTVGNRAFGAAAARIWNSLPLTVTTAETLNSFKKHLKTHLFHCSFHSL